MLDKARNNNKQAKVPNQPKFRVYKSGNFEKNQANVNNNSKSKLDNYPRASLEIISQ